MRLQQSNQRWEHAGFDHQLKRRIAAVKQLSAVCSGCQLLFGTARLQDSYHLQHLHLECSKFGRAWPTNGRCSGLPVGWSSMAIIITITDTSISGHSSSCIIASTTFSTCTTTATTATEQSSYCTQ
jgi:imidazoleglycerol phosphate synthase glutamine amidotransferase subunit HisH